MTQREIWTLTVDPRDNCGISTTVHRSEQEAIDCLFDNYNQHGMHEPGDLQGLIDGECLVVHIESHRLAPDIERAPRPDGKVRMTNAQRDRLWAACGGFNVPFREDDYHPGFDLPPGWVTGWLGGCDGRRFGPDDGRRTIEVGVSPEGESHS